MLNLLKDTQNLPSPLVQCFAKPGKAMSARGSHEWLSTLATNTEHWAEGISITVSVTDCLQN